MKKCPECKHENNDSERWCTICGYNIKDVAVSKESKSKNSNRIGIRRNEIEKLKNEIRTGTASVWIGVIVIILTILTFPFISIIFLIFVIVDGSRIPKKKDRIRELEIEIEDLK